MTQPRTRRQVGAGHGADGGVPILALTGSPIRSQVVFVGPVGVGKTTAVHTLSSIDVVGTEARMLDEPVTPPGVLKLTTTVGIDFGVWKRSDGSAVGLVGTAGQERFAASRAPLRNPASGVVLLVFGDRPSLEADVVEWIHTVGGADLGPRLVVGVNYGRDDSIARVAHALYETGTLGVPIVHLDPRCHRDVSNAVETLLDMLEALHS